MKNFQDIIMTLNNYWSQQGCIVWHPHNVQVGAGTGNPATVLRALGPEPFNVAYLEPSARPADGRYGENPNRFYEYYQYQVILKPAPKDNISLYLNSLEALGLDWRKHDIRFVEDNWQSPSLGAWGLGWEVWLNGLEITQYTYFQQAAGNDLDPVCVEITYGLERIAMYLQGVQSIPEILWLDDIRYGDLHLPDEVDYCKYNFDYANVERLQQMYNLFEAEARSAIEAQLVLPAHDYILKCSHIFNVMDARGSIGVTQRAEYFTRMRELARQVADIYLNQREGLGYPLANRRASHLELRHNEIQSKRDTPQTLPTSPSDFLVEIGIEELPANDLSSAISQLKTIVPQYLEEARLKYEGFKVLGTPLRLVIYIEKLASKQDSHERLVRGPAAQVAFDFQNQPTQAAYGFARSVGSAIEELELVTYDGKQYLSARIVEAGSNAVNILEKLLPRLIAELKFPLMMRWNETQTAFSRPIRWLVALYDDALLDFSYAGVETGRFSRGLRLNGQAHILVPKASDYFELMRDAKVVIDPDERYRTVIQEARQLAASVNGSINIDKDLTHEIVNLVEHPYAILGSFKEEFLQLPSEVLITVMKKHQRYFPVFRDGKLLPFFVTIANGLSDNIDVVRQGNEAVIRARFTDAQFFFNQDVRSPLSAFAAKLNGLSFHLELGSYHDKSERLRPLMLFLAKQFGYSETIQSHIPRLASIIKADLVTNMVIEFTSLQGVMGWYYAIRAGELPEVADAIRQHYLPRFLGDDLPSSQLGIIAALADKLDTLLGLFAIGLEPSGSADPYSLRRAALNIVQILVEHRLSLSLDALLYEATLHLPVTVSEDQQRNTKIFLIRRFQSWLADKGFRYDHIEAILSSQSDNPAMAYQSLEQLDELAQKPAFREVTRAYVRVAKLVQNQPLNGEFVAENLSDDNAYALYNSYQAVKTQIGTSHDIRTVISALTALVAPIDNFFTQVMVMHEKPAIREARVHLLRLIALLPKHIIDLTKITENA